MNLENMKCFISLAECLNFTKAADKEHITQTSMSRKISSLEEVLMDRLFYRDNHSVVLTDAGGSFISRPRGFWRHIMPPLKRSRISTRALPDR